MASSLHAFSRYRDVRREQRKPSWDFRDLLTWLNVQLSTYIGDNFAHVATAMEPAVVTLATLYVMLWGYLQLTGRIEEPFVSGLKRILTIAVVLGVSLRMWLYNNIIVDTFYHAPVDLAQAVIGATDPVKTIDSIWAQGGAVAGYLFSNGGVFRGDPGFYIAGIVVWVLMGLLCVYTMFLIALSHVALAILLALGRSSLRCCCSRARSGCSMPGSRSLPTTRSSPC